MKRLLILIAACGPAVKGPVTTKASALGSEITLYRDAALVKQRLEVDVAPASTATIKTTIPAGVNFEDISIIDRGDLTLSEIRAAAAPTEPVANDVDVSGVVTDTATGVPVPAYPLPIEIEVSAPRAGHYALTVAYTTDRIRWDTAYTLTTTVARDQAILRGAIAMRNTTGLELKRTRVWIVDTELGAAKGKIAEELAAKATGAEPTTTPTAQPRDLGVVDVGKGETRIDLLHGDHPRTMRSVLVYDPIGTKLDNPTYMPQRDEGLGVKPSQNTTVAESFEVERDTENDKGLPGGPVRLLERHPDGSLAVLAEARIFDASTRVAAFDTLNVGIAEGVTGKRERRDFSVDDERKRLVEEFLIEIDNTRSVPIQVVLREHMYRGQNWTIAYSLASTNPTKDGPQQVSMRTSVPAKGKTRVPYVVVYTWPQ